MQFKILIVICLSFTLLSGLLSSHKSVNADSADFFHFESITTENGLSHNMVMTVIQDHYGYMWFGTASGLNKYDGLHFSIFQRTNDEGSISNSEILCIYETSDNQILVGTRNGLNCFDRTNNTFIKYYNDPSDKNSISDNTVWAILEDSFGVLWIGTSNGLNIFDIETETFVNYMNVQDDSASISDNFITKIYEDNQGNLWIGTSDGLNKFDRGTDTFKRYKHDADNPVSISDNRITGIYEDSYGTLWIGTSAGLNICNRYQDSFISYIHEMNDASSISCNYITSLCEDQDGYLWIGTLAGLDRFDHKNGVFQNCGATLNTKNGLNSDYINSLYVDNQSNLWIGSAYGINMLNFNQQSFRYYPEINGAVMNICSLDNIHLWLKLRHDLYEIDSESHSVVNHWTDVFTEQEFSHHWMSTFCIDTNGYLWAGTENSGLQKFDPETGELFNFTHEDDNLDTLPSNTILSLCSGSNGDIWVGTSQGLCRYDATSDKFIKYIDGSDYSPDIMNGNIQLVHQLPNSDLWLSTEVGFYKIDGQTGKTTRIIYYLELPGNLYNNIVRSIDYDDEANTLWMVTGYGIYRYDISRGILQSSGQLSSPDSDGVLLNTLQGQRDILKDKNGNIWISTSSLSLWKFSPASEMYTQYQRRDGLLFEAYSYSASCETISGELFFGSISGLVSFNPDSLKKYNYIPSVIISDFNTLEKPISLDQPIEDIKQITLPYSNNNFDISFSAFDYNNPIDIQFGYKLEGFDEDWNYTRAFNNSTRYTHLPSGTYNLLVKVSSDNIKWHDGGIALTIIITPVFWQEWWFICIVLLTAIALVIFVIFYRTRSLSRRALQLESQIAQRTRQLSEKTQQLELELKRRLEYSRMLVHELKSPLTSLQITTEVLSETATGNPYKEVAFNISNSVDNLKTKVDGLLDIAKGEVGLFKLDYKDTNLNDLFTRLETELMKIAAVKKREIEFHIPSDLPSAMIDSEKLSQVIWNLVDNAMKFTPKGGTVIIEVGIEQNERLALSVSDNGHGMSAEKQSKLFKPLIDNPHDISDSQRLTGLGIGLILSKMIIDLHGGYIKVESRLKRGSIFTFSIPLSPNGKINKQEEGYRHESINN